ncbi:hypothetical protein B9Z55_011269 [Caenorhabditis nigoni]|uniref:Uncharacterized protein n=1 Tax=Caenorhabditis nigoni TaxID=1611254 RepID=A0A2G5UJF0_9PELO|nr:hypothetical protein B9Z55_011269 [Caenorhabditis nigoni]
MSPNSKDIDGRELIIIRIDVIGKRRALTSDNAFFEMLEWESLVGHMLKEKKSRKQEKCSCQNEKEQQTDRHAHTKPNFPYFLTFSVIKIIRIQSTSTKNSGPPRTSRPTTQRGHHVQRIPTQPAVSTIHRKTSRIPNQSLTSRKEHQMPS